MAPHQEQDPPPTGRPPSFDAFPPWPGWPRLRPRHLPAPARRILPRAPPGPRLPPAKTPLQEPSPGRMGGGGAGPPQIRVPPLTKALSFHGPLQVRRGSHTPDEIW